MELLDSLQYSSYIRFLQYNKIENIDKYKSEYLEYLKTGNKENISEPLKFFLKEVLKEKINENEIRRTK